MNVCNEKVIFTRKLSKVFSTSHSYWGRILRNSDAGESCCEQRFFYQIFLNWKRFQCNVWKQRYVQTVLGNYYPLAREVCEAGSTLPCGKNQGNVLINISYNCRAFDDNTVLFLCHSLHKVISANIIPEMWKGGEEVLRNVWEDGRRYLCKIWFESCQILISIFWSLETFGGGVPMKSSPSKLPPSAARLAYLSACVIWLFFFSRF